MNVFRKITEFFVTIVQRYLPDPFLFAVLLTFITFFLGIVITNQSPIQMLDHWGSGLWSLLTFAMQMSLILITGHTLALTAPVKRLLQSMARIPKTPGAAIMTVTLVSACASYLNWGFGLVVGALYARELARTIPNVDYRLLIASSYTGFIVWHAGISGTIPLLLASGGSAVYNIVDGAISQPIPISQTIFALYGWVPALIIIVTLPFLNRAMHPSPERTISIDPELLEPEMPEFPVANYTFADRLENARWISVGISVMGIAYIVRGVLVLGGLNLDLVIGLFLFVGILLHGVPRKFISAFTLAAKGASPILLQYPLYAGIMGMMGGDNPVTGVSLAGYISNFFVSISTETTFPVYAFLSAGIINFFVPSGGGQWAIQAPFIIPAAVKIGARPAEAAMAIAWGDAWTNMIQPFWALPALGIAGLGARDIMGYCVVVLIYTGIIISVCHMLF